MMATDQELVNALVKECDRLNFPLQRISIDELIRRAESMQESFLYFCLPHQKEEILAKTQISERWMLYKMDPAVFCVEIPDDEDDVKEGWMPAATTYEIVNSMHFYSNGKHGDHCYLIQDSDYKAINISEFI